jgi:hypothetical protein
VVLHFAAKTHGKEIDKITTTPVHPFYVIGKGFTPAGQLAVGNSIATRAGPPVVLVRIERIHTNKSVPVYNFTIQDDHTYFVGLANGGEWVHNAKACTPKTLTRFGKDFESREKLAADAAKAQANGFPHGVSAIGDATKSGSVANYEDVANNFNVIKTGNNPSHYTIELPNPVTDDVTDTFNKVFGR